MNISDYNTIKTVLKKQMVKIKEQILALSISPRKEGILMIAVK